MLKRLILVSLLGSVAAVGAGCGDGDPYLEQPSTTTTIAGDPRQPPPERTGPRPEIDDDVADAEPTPAAAVRRYAQLSISWTADTLAANQRELARIAIGGARQTALLAAQRAARDDTLARSQVSNSGTVIAVAQGAASVRESWVVVTREQMTGRDSYDGLPPTYHVTLVRLKRLPAGWVVSSWAPQS